MFPLTCRARVAILGIAAGGFALWPTGAPVGALVSEAQRAVAPPGSKAVAAGDLWLARAIRVLAGAGEPVVDVAAPAQSQVRLVMTSAQRTTVIAIGVGVIPLAWVLLGGVLVWWRRRRAGP